MSSSEQPECLFRLSGADAISLLEIFHRCLSLNTEEDIIDLFPKIQELFPFDFAAALLGFNDDGKGPVILHGLNISFPEEWRREIC